MATVINGSNSFAAPTSTVSLTPSTAGICHAPQITPESARKASELLQENHVKNHIFFNESGFHNHIAHHLLTLFAMGGKPNQIQRGFTANQSYQRPQLAVKNDALEQMLSSREKVASFYGNDKYFRSFEEFFAGQIEQKGIKETLAEWVFKGDDVADGMFTRLFAGFFHPIIHFGFGLEFHQPAIVIEGLAEAAVHGNWVSPYLLGCEKAAASSASSKKTLIELLHEARANEVIRNAPHADDNNKTRDGVLGRAIDPMITVASQWTVSPNLDDIRSKTAEMIQTSTYFTAGAQNPAKIPKFDFFYMHCINTSVFFSAFVDDDETRAVFGDGDTGLKNLARLVEMKGRTDLAEYMARGAPELDMQRIREYEPRHPAQKWDEIFERACAYDDDGHTSKLVRAVANGERACAPYEAERDWPVKGDMWLKIGHMVMDSVEAGGPRWVRSTGFEGAWDEVPDRQDAKL